jgi:beta-glucosidase
MAHTLLQDLLTTIREEWGYKGVVMTDWFGGYSSFKNTFTTGQVSDVVKQLTAGNDLLMPGLQSQQESILKNIKNGTLSQGDVATNLSRILELVLKSPAMNNYKYSNKPNLKENAQITRQAAAEGTILLKQQ